MSLLVVAPCTPESIPKDEISGKPLLLEEEKESDGLDIFNHPRIRRALILHHFLATTTDCTISFASPESPCSDFKSAFRDIHSEGLLDFLDTAWQEWVDMGEEGRDMDHIPSQGDGIPNLIPGNSPLPRDPYQDPSSNVMGKIGYYCTDDCTPVFASLHEELSWDCAVVKLAVDRVLEAPSTPVYAIPTHPGHHAATDSFGGYCYLNQAAHAARLFQSHLGAASKVAVIDVGKWYCTQ